MIIDATDLQKLRHDHRDQTIALGSGVFDLMHVGHVQYLQRLSELGDVVVVMVKSDERVHRGKGPLRPVLPQDDRAAVVDAIKGVDFTFVAPHFDFSDHGHEIDPMYRMVIGALRPDIFYSTNPIWQQLEKLDGLRVIIEDRPNDTALHSTTSIIDHIRSKFSG